MGQIQRSHAEQLAGPFVELLDVDIQVKQKPDSLKLTGIKGEIVLDNVNFSYIPGVEVLSGIDLRVSPGETVALVGPTGAGKSTIINLIDRFYDVTGGLILNRWQ